MRTSVGASWARYRRVLGVPRVRNVLLIGVAVRVPLFASMVLLTVHVVQTLDRSYTAAGALSMAATVAVAISGPWRGRLLDRLGLRRVVLPSVLVTAVCWSVAPFSSYAVLLVLACVAGLFAVPTFSIIRAAVLSMVPEEDRRTALSLDSALVEIAFMVGPVVGVWAGTVWPTSWVLFGIEMAAALAGLALWLLNPPLHGDLAAQPPEGAAAEGSGPVPFRSWFTGPVVVLCAGAAASTLVLAGSDLALVAAMREFAAYEHIGQLLAVWGAGSLVGGLVYGGLGRSLPPFALLTALAVTTVPMAFAGGPWSLAAIAFASGLFCAPTITATVERISDVVPAVARGEAMGWHGSAMTAGSALGAPLSGFAIDRWGFGGGFVVVGGLGALMAVIGGVVLARRRPPPAAVVAVGTKAAAAGAGSDGAEVAAGQPVASGRTAADPDVVPVREPAPDLR